ncbi:MAG: protease modulator HflC, partial [Desulfocapsa sp.]|nr:protease modulator HflC [Desulfocapsa sp.]
MKQIVQFFLIGLVLLSITVVYDGFFILKEGQQAMITQFGAPVGEPKTEAGFHLKLPFVQDVNYFDKRIQIWDGDPNQIPTNDKT